MTSDLTSPSDFQIKDFQEVTGKSASEFKQVIARFNYKTLWTYSANCILGLWLITSPHLFEYKSSALETSDTVSGVLVIFFECLAFLPRLYLVRLCTGVVALWLLFAPLVFWSPTPTVFLNDTLIACCLITFAILVPGTPGSGGAELPGPDQPPGWTYNPSSWIRRWLGIALALLGFFISRYLAARQLGYIPHAYDPFFGNGSEQVLHSSVSKAFPISDAGFGSVAYIMEVLTGFMGDKARWRTMPWIAVMFALLVIPLGMTSVVLVMMQPMIVGAWCGLCLITATGLITSVPLAVHEAIAVGMFLFQAKQQNKNVWEILCRGGSILGPSAGNMDPDRMNYSFAQRYVASIQGVTVPWMLGLQIVLGIWLMARPNVLPANIMTANTDHLIGAMVVTVATLATAEVTRLARYISVPLGAILAICALIFARDFPVVMINELICGIVIAVVSFPRGEIVEKYAAWDKFVK